LSPLFEATKSLTVSACLFSL